MELTEREWQTQVIELARLMGFRLAHFRPAKDRRGRWSTPMSGDVGFPDLVLVGHGRLVFAELKTATGKVTPDQQAWLDALDAVPGVVARVFRPDDLDELAAVLRGRA